MPRKRTVPIACRIFLAALICAVWFSGVSLAAERAPYVASNYSDRYHRADCKIAAKIPADELIEFSTPEEAIAHELAPCKKCNPPTTSTPVSDRKSR